MQCFLSFEITTLLNRYIKNQRKVLLLKWANILESLQLFVESLPTNCLRMNKNLSLAPFHMEYQTTSEDFANVSLLLCRVSKAGYGIVA